MKCTGVILGGGIIGSAVAYELSRRGHPSLHVLDADLEGELSSTERNAGGVRHLWLNQINYDLAKVSIEFFKSVQTEVGFHQNGYLWLFSSVQKEAAEQFSETVHKLKAPYEILDVDQIQKQYPFIDKTEDLAFALFGAQDGLINSNALKNYFRQKAKENGVQFHDQVWIKDLHPKDSGASIEVAKLNSQDQAHKQLKNPEQEPSTTEVWEAESVVFCLGAWINQLPFFKKAQLPLQPVRRQISLFKAENFDMSPYGMVVDPSKVYFHPEGGNLLAGYVLPDEPPGYNFSYDSDFFENHIWPALYERSSKLERLKHMNGWAGLYHYTPDTSGILGAIPEYKGIYEAHSFTGRGVMQSYGAAIAIADLVTTGQYDRLDASSLSRTRFKDRSQWLEESLHI